MRVSKVIYAKSRRKHQCFPGELVMVVTHPKSLLWFEQNRILFPRLASTALPAHWHFTYENLGIYVALHLHESGNAAQRKHGASTEW